MPGRPTGPGSEAGPALQKQSSGLQKCLPPPPQTPRALSCDPPTELGEAGQNILAGHGNFHQVGETGTGIGVSNGGKFTQGIVTRCWKAASTERDPRY